MTILTDKPRFGMIRSVAEIIPRWDIEALFRRDIVSGERLSLFQLQNIGPLAAGDSLGVSRSLFARSVRTCVHSARDRVRAFTHSSIALLNDVNVAV